jgi:hypothetical protein
MRTLLLPSLVAALFLISGLVNLWTYYRVTRSKSVYLYLGVMNLFLALVLVSAAIAGFNESPAARFAALSHEVQQLKQEMPVRVSDPKAREEYAQELREVERELADEKVSEPILPQVPWNVLTVAMLVLAAVVPGGIYLRRSARRRSPGVGDPDATVT